MSVRSVRSLLHLRGASSVVQRRQLSSFLHSPMYPQRAAVDIPEQPKKDGEPEDDDFLSRHGGKVALAGFGLAIALVYRWFKGGSNKNITEQAIKSTFLVDPSEFNELRHSNNISINLYTEIIVDAHAAFPDNYASYEEFIVFVQKKLKEANQPPLAYAHILDRLVLPSIEGERKNSDIDSDSDLSAAYGSDWRSALSEDGRLPLQYLLVVFNAAVRERADKRLVALFCIAKNSTDSEAGDDQISSACNEEELLSIVKDLQSCCQIPAEKQVIETGNYIPFKTFRRKTAKEMLEEAVKDYEDTKIDDKKPVFDRKNIDEATFMRILEGNSICVWGQCYYAAKK